MNTTHVLIFKLFWLRFRRDLSVGGEGDEITVPNIPMFVSIFFLNNYIYVVGFCSNHKVLIYIEHHSVCPLVGIGTPPPL
jgi:hypothetical protein